MRDVDLCETILKAIERQSGGAGVSAVAVRIGVLHGVSESLFRAAFAVVAVGTVAAQARLAVVLAPVQIRCRNCGRDIDCAPICNFCGSSDLRVDGGDEIMVESITLVDQKP